MRRLVITWMWLFCSLCLSVYVTLLCFGLLLCDDDGIQTVYFLVKDFIECLVINVTTLK